MAPLAFFILPSSYCPVHIAQMIACQKIELNNKGIDNLDEFPHPLALFAAGTESGTPANNLVESEVAGLKSDFRAYWSSPEITLVAIGETISGPIDDIDWIASLPEEAILIGGAQFAPPGFQTPNPSKTKPTPTQHLSQLPWKGFGTSRMVLPRFLVCYRKKSVDLIQTFETPKSLTSKTQAQVAPEFEELLRKAQDIQLQDFKFQSSQPPNHQLPEELQKKSAKKSNGNTASDPACNVLPLNTDTALSPEDIANAIVEIQKGNLEKVVLASCQTFANQSSPEYLLSQLQEKFKSCVTFALALKEPEEAIFLGATPELLLKLKGNTLQTAALASSAPRGASSQEDQQLAQNLLTDQKEMNEHLWVVRHLLQSLKAAGVQLSPTPEPAVLKLPGIQHIHTPINGTAPSSHILDILGNVAPTPAVAGTPTPTALDLIAATENFDRGWYAGSVGWCTPAGDGEFWTALRSALMMPQTNEISLFAGAGIVADSVPELELAEIELKFQSLKNLL